MTAASPLRMILDCDPGIDDALAIALAVSLGDVLALTTVGGNVAIEHTTRNAGSILALLGRPDIPVHVGAQDPLAGPIPLRAEEYHGLNGLGGATVPPPAVEPASWDAPGAIVRLVREHPGCWLVPTGPLTNLALAIRRDPEVLDHVAGISWMGGSTGSGNVTACAEFNAWVDPEAAAEVVDACAQRGTRFVMAGLNVTHSVTIDEDEVSRWTGTARGDAFAALLGSYLAQYRINYTLPGAAVHDALAVVAVTHPSLVTCTALPIGVDCSNGPNRGRVWVDDRPLLNAARSNAEVMINADAAAVVELIRGAVR